MIWEILIPQSKNSMLCLRRNRRLLSNLFSSYFNSHCVTPIMEEKISHNEPMVIENNKRPAPEENNENLPKKQMTEMIRVKRRNYALLLAYLGKNYAGMQRNPGMKTIDEELINALLKADLITNEAFDMIQTIQYQRAARTDKGVSAVRQVVSVKLPENVCKNVLNGFLPDDIKVFGIKRVTKGFNSKSHCSGRTYTYTLPTYSFAPESSNIPPRDVDIDARMKELLTIDGKPLQEYRISADIIARIVSSLKIYEGTHNFHNFTSKVKPLDPRAQRYIIETSCSEPFISDSMEFITLEIKGQSFMLHQIRKMVALVISVVRNIIREEIISEAFTPPKLDLPMAPSLGLVLQRVHYDGYNKRYGSDGIHETLDWTECDEEITKFTKDYILKHITETEKRENAILSWLATLPSHKFSVREEREEREEPTDD
ncbi:tRNA pseudouridine synthase A isoform X2 [Orussus abietinus]|uniref:tRNA pseudouridine synthase A isoform X2 n=1 Tax=Orussus abietinus TaxID=222816 RepID=UPI0006257335|nr:tRNA pseudouridine synthase A isoform X2 [Orussus abietinus]